MDWVKRLGNSRRMIAWCRVASESGGAEIAETALVMPLVFLFLLGIFWFGRAYNVYSTITYAAREGALTAARANCASCTPPNTPTTDLAVATRVSAVLQASKLDPTPIAVYTVTPAPVFCQNITPPGACAPPVNNITVCRGVRLTAATSTLPACGALVSFQYPYQFYLPFTSLNMQLFNLPAAAEVPMEY
jgi:Flp pilus assembly protein TadG